MNVNTDLIHDWEPASADELRRLIEENLRGTRHKILPVGGGTSLPPIAVTARLQTSQLNRVIDYPHRDMTITVEAGICMQELVEILAAKGQQLPIDVPQLSRATLGGAIASNVSGPGRYGYGTLRDYVIGISAVDGQGRLFSAGGRVVKNVAGYDLCKLLIGSEGTLAVITQVTLKLKPVVPSRIFVSANFGNAEDVDAALGMLNHSQTRPVVLDVLNSKGTGSTPGPYLMHIGYAGSTVETTWQAATVRQELATTAATNIVECNAEDAARLWSELTQFQLSEPKKLAGVVQVLPSRAARCLEVCEEFSVQLHAGSGTMKLRLPTEGDVLAMVVQCRRRLHEFEGTLAILNPPQAWSVADRLGTLPQSWRLTQQIKATLDPAGLLSPDWFDT